MSCNKQIRTEYLGDVPIDTLESLPDYFLAERIIEDPATGNSLHSLVRVPAAKILPNANTDNLFSLVANNTAIVIPKNQVRGVRIVQEVSTNKMYFADNTHAPMMLALGVQADMIICQSTGVINLPNGHSYNIGVQYYQGANGEPTTTVGNHKLFTPVSSTKLLINM